MKKAIIYLLVVFVLFSVGCGLKGILPSECDGIAEYSFLCNLADRFDTRLEDIGNALIIVNSILIGEEIYTKEQALEISADMKDILKNPISWLAFGEELERNTEKYPGLYDVSELYIAEFSKSTEIIGEFDKEKLIGFFSRIETILLK